MIFTIVEGEVVGVGGEKTIISFLVITFDYYDDLF